MALDSGGVRHEALAMKHDPVTLQLVRDSLLYASEEMGLALRNAAYSPNIKERMDHSAAVFDARGLLLSQAEHIPVHLGSLPWGLSRLLESCRAIGLELEDGCMIACNDPYLTGTHLNDVTVLAPVHHRGEMVAYVVNKAHHADVGGVYPGSISMDATSLEEEGFVLEPRYLVRYGKVVKGTVEALARASRTGQERRGDLRAQVAANVTGARRVKDVLEREGADVFAESAKASFRSSESLMKKRMEGLARGVYKAEDVVEGRGGDELFIRVKLSVTTSQILVDYSGTDRQVDYPLNAVFGVTLSGAYFALRCITGADIPANHGAFLPIKVFAPEGTILNPTSPHPVAGGNVEVSQRNADVVFRALSEAAPGRVPAAAGGSMNNVMVGGGGSLPWAFYETNGVGLGGQSEQDGIDGIQCNMTNTMNTPVEELERAYPVMIARYEFRPDSSGRGRHRGGSGLIRAYRALRDRTTFTVMADRETHLPWGLEGGGEGAGTRVYLVRGGSQSRVPSKYTIALRKGDVVEVWTAGGGGYGDPRSRPDAEVERDVEAGLLTRKAAHREYGLRRSGRA
jgi:N-methylhydantoinase B